MWSSDSGTPDGIPTPLHSDVQHGTYNDATAACHSRHTHTLSDDHAPCCLVCMYVLMVCVQYTSVSQMFDTLFSLSTVLVACDSYWIGFPCYGCDAGPECTQYTLYSHASVRCLPAYVIRAASMHISLRMLSKVIAYDIFQICGVHGGRSENSGCSIWAALILEHGYITGEAPMLYSKRRQTEASSTGSRGPDVVVLVALMGPFQWWVPGYVIYFYVILSLRYWTGDYIYVILANTCRYIATPCGPLSCSYWPRFVDFGRTFCALEYTYVACTNMCVFIGISLIFSQYVRDLVGSYLRCDPSPWIVCADGLFLAPDGGPLVMALFMDYVPVYTVMPHSVLIASSLSLHVIMVAWLATEAILRTDHVNGNMDLFPRTRSCILRDDSTLYLRVASTDSTNGQNGCRPTFPSRDVGGWCHIHGESSFLSNVWHCCVLCMPGPFFLEECSTCRTLCGCDNSLPADIFWFVVSQLVIAMNVNEYAIHPKLLNAPKVKNRHLEYEGF